MKKCTKSECTYNWDTPPISSTGSVPILKTITSLLLLVNISQINPRDRENGTLNVTITYNRTDLGCECIWKNWFLSSLSTQPPPPPNNHTNTHTNPSIPLSQLAYTSTQTKPWWLYILCMKLMFYNKLLWSISMHLSLISENKIMFFSLRNILTLPKNQSPSRYSEKRSSYSAPIFQGGRERAVQCEKPFNILTEKFT